MEDKEWSQDEEDEPLKIQREAMEIQRELIGIVRKKQAEEEARKHIASNIEGHTQSIVGYAIELKRPSLEQVISRQVRIWKAVKSALPDAPEAVLLAVFHSAQQSEEDSNTAVGDLPGVTADPQ